jgi:hypothetical protein
MNDGVPSVIPTFVDVLRLESWRSRAMPKSSTFT